jgi:hypothetical protein
MKPEEAPRAILRRWRAKPAAERQTQTQAVAFAKEIKDKYAFRYSGDRYQIIKGWLISELPTQNRIMAPG